jgi:hypothetical protein
MTALPPTFDHFGAELENAVRRDLGARRRRRRMLRAAALSAAAVAAAFGLLSALPTGGPSVVERAAAALERSDDTILHYQLSGEQRNPDGSVVTWRSESWDLRAAPFTGRQIEVGPDGVRAETLTRGDTNELYDVRTKTIYVASRQELVAGNLPKIKIVPQSKIAKITRDPRVDTVLVHGKGGKRPTVVTTEQGARRLREQLAQGDPPGQEPTADQRVEGPRGEILALLESGRARETGRVEVGGRDAIRIESPDGRQVYLVNATTYAPIEWTSAGNGGGVTLRFPVYEELPVDSESMELLDLEAQHPGARVVRDPAAYLAAEARLFPHG